MPHCYKRSRPLIDRFRPATTKKQQRRLQYAHMQTLSRHRIEDAASTIVTGQWETAHENRPSTGSLFDDYWREKLSAAALPDNREPRSLVSATEELIAPITISDVVWALKEMRGSAAGMDYIKPEDLLRNETKFLTGYINFLLGCSCVLPQINVARVTLVPKCENPTSPSDYRPISVAPVIVRCLHKILAERWTPYLDRQDDSMLPCTEMDVSKLLLSYMPSYAMRTPTVTL